MNQEDGADDSESIAGESIEDAVDAIVERDDSLDPEAVRTTLRLVAEDGAVSREARDATLAELSKVVSTPETRVELASMALSDARETADPVSDLDVVRTRLDGFEARVDAVESQVTDLGADLQRLVQRSEMPVGLYETAREMRRIDAEANRLHRTADELATEIESFEEWVEDSEVRFEELTEDADALEHSVEELASTADELANAAGGDGAEGPMAAGTDLGAVWLDLSLRRRLQDLLLADLRAELDALRAWADREGDDVPERAGSLEFMFDDLDARLTTTGEELQALAREDWRNRFGDRLAAFEDELAGVDHPVNWGEVQAAFDEHRVEQA